MAYDPIKAGSRIRDMRVINGLSQSEMAQKLAAIIKNRVLDKSNGKNTVSQMERGARGITLAYAFAYADIFGVSLDYILGRSDDWHSTFKPVKELTGLSDEALATLERLSEEYKEPEGLQETLKKIAEFDKNWKMLEAGISVQLSAAKATDEEIEKLKGYAQNKSDKATLDSINNLLSSEKGLTIIGCLESYANTCPSEMIRIDSAALNQTIPGRIKINKSAIYAHMIMQSATEYREERQGNNKITERKVNNIAKKD